MSIGNLLCDIGPMVQTIMNPTAESIYEEVCDQYDIDDRKMSEEQIEAVKAFLGRAKIIKAGKKGKLLKIGKQDSEK